MPVQTYEGAELIEILNKKQERTILGMFAWAKNLARTESSKSNHLETMEQVAARAAKDTTRRGAKIIRRIGLERIRRRRRG